MSEAKEDVLDRVLRVSKEIEAKRASLAASVDELKSILTGGKPALDRTVNAKPVKPAQKAGGERRQAAAQPTPDSLREAISRVLRTKYRNRGAGVRELRLTLRKSEHSVVEELRTMKTEGLVYAIQSSGRNRWLVAGDAPVRQRAPRSSQSPLAGKEMGRQRRQVIENAELRTMISEKLLSAMETKDDSITGLTRRIGHGFYEVKTVLGDLLSSGQAESYTFTRKGREFTYYRLPTAADQAAAAEPGPSEAPAPVRRGLGDVMGLVDELTGVPGNAASNSAPSVEPG